MPIARSRISACTIMTPKWDIGECIDGWHRAGLSALGVPIATLEAFGMEAGVRALESSGLSLANLQIQGTFDLEDPERFQARLPELLSWLDVAATLEADCVYAPPGFRGHLDWDTAADRLLAQIELLLPYIHDRGLRLALEPMHPMRQDLSFVNLAADTVEVVNRVQDEAVGYVYDYYHLWWQRGAIELIERTASQIFSVQPSDHKKVTMRTLDRAVPGQGIIPIGALTAALEAGGYRGYYDLEVLSDDNDERGYDQTLELCVNSFGDAVGGLLD